jgi:hypothetical protein
MANQFGNATAKNVGTNPVDIYTTGATTRATIIGINIANTSTSDIEVSIKMRDSTSSEYFIVKDTPIARYSALAAMGGDQKLVMAPNNVLIVETNKENAADVIVSYLEITAS